MPATALPPPPPPRTLRWRAWAMAALAAAALLGAALWGAATLGGAGNAPPVALEGDVCIVAPPTPYDAASGLAPGAARAVPADVRCPVCGMFPARAPDWAAQVIFANGDAHFFDSPLSLFMYLHDVPRYSPGRDARQIVAQYVTDAGTPPGDGASRWTDARSAFYVHGSSAKGPMRAGNLPAFATREAAQAFAARRGGQVLAFGAIDAALVTQLGGQSSHSHH